MFLSLLPSALKNQLADVTFRNKYTNLLNSLGSKAAPQFSFAMCLKRLEFSSAETDEVRKRIHCYGCSLSNKLIVVILLV